MVWIFADCVRELATSPLAGTFTPFGAPALYRTFDSVMNDGDTCGLKIEEASGGTKWMSCRATYSGGSLLVVAADVYAGSAGVGILETFDPDDSLHVWLDAPARYLRNLLVREEVAFAYGDASPKPLVTAVSGKLIQRVSIYLTTAFNGVGAALAVGDAGDSTRLMATTFNDPTTVGVYGTQPSYSYGADTPLILTITPGAGATQGAGLLVIESQP